MGAGGRGGALFHSHTAGHTVILSLLFSRRTRGRLGKKKLLTKNRQFKK